MAGKKQDNKPDFIEKKRTSSPKSSLPSARVPEKSVYDGGGANYHPVGRPDPNSLGNQAMIFIMIVLAVFFAFCILLTDMKKGVNGISGPIGYYTCKFLYGFFGYGAWFVPLVFIGYAAFWKKSVERNILVPKIVIGACLMASFSTFIQVVGLNFGFYDRNVKFFAFDVFWDFMSKKSGGGIIGGALGTLLYAGFKTVALVVVGVIVLVAVMFMFEITPARLGRLLLRFWRWFSARVARSYAHAKERRAQRREAAALEAARRKDEEERLAKEEEARLAKERAEKAEREKAEKAEREKKLAEEKRLAEEAKAREKAEKEATAANLARENAVKAENSGAKDGYITSYNDSNVKKEKTPEKKTVEVTPVKLVEVKGYKTAEDVAPSVPDIEEEDDEPWENMSYETAYEEIKDEDVKTIFSETNKKAKKDEDLRPGEFIPPSEKEYDIDGNELCAPKKEIAQNVSDSSKNMITPNEFDDLPIEVMEVERENVVPEVEVPTEKPYQLPPIDLLSVGEAPSDGDSPEELEANAKRLVEVLRSFKVDVEIVHISHGPTITRYEVAPKAGVKVRSIAGLVDDIALNMKTTGVRIEPIPGKVAVGIEVPNRCRATVFLRNLIDTDQFRNAKSKVTCALGMNIAGEPVFLDIAKMPHLLIAGATGMGKSVCINSLLVSLLYRAKPDEVKLILVDPKKVELNTYNRLPHLLVPVLNAPQKAAGALAWAVIEMERRFTLIEQYGVRNLAGYNAIAAQNEDMECLPHIIIVIDELADLMMQAHDDVEDSICRLAAKARAAGMHMIVGTQRPSVDVITGLIKANIPSRIAFTVASNADSRTIIDVAGAEKLIGRGDMLYAPVQEMKALRLQGAFVSDSEVESVVDFIKDQCDVSFDSDIIDEIEEQAALCGEKKKKGGFGGSSSGDSDADDGELDPKFYEAVELAVDEGKISTSLIQRKLSLGYGRAAKIIDEMEKRGIVSAPDGQKPRTVLISQQDYYEMRIRHNMSETGSSYSGDE